MNTPPKKQLQKQWEHCSFIERLDRNPDRLVDEISTNWRKRHINAYLNKSVEETFETFLERSDACHSETNAYGKNVTVRDPFKADDRRMRAEGTFFDAEYDPSDPSAMSLKRGIKEALITHKNDVETALQKPDHPTIILTINYRDPQDPTVYKPIGIGFKHENDSRQITYSETDAFTVVLGQDASEPMPYVYTCYPDVTAIDALKHNSQASPEMNDTLRYVQNNPTVKLRSNDLTDMYEESDYAHTLQSEIAALEEKIDEQGRLTAEQAREKEQILSEQLNQLNVQLTELGEQKTENAEKAREQIKEQIQNLTDRHEQNMTVLADAFKQNTDSDFERVGELKALHIYRTLQSCDIWASMDDKGKGVCYIEGSKLIFPYAEKEFHMDITKQNPQQFVFAAQKNHALNINSPQFQGTSPKCSRVEIDLKDFTVTDYAPAPICSSFKRDAVKRRAAMANEAKAQENASGRRSAGFAHQQCAISDAIRTIGEQYGPLEERASDVGMRTLAEMKTTLPFVKPTGPYNIIIDQLIAEYGPPTMP